VLPGWGGSSSLNWHCIIPVGEVEDDALSADNWCSPTYRFDVLTFGWHDSVCSTHHDEALVSHCPASPAGGAGVHPSVLAGDGCDSGDSALTMCESPSLQDTTICFDDGWLRHFEAALRMLTATGFGVRTRCQKAVQLSARKR